MKASSVIVFLGCILARGVFTTKAAAAPKILWEVPGHSDWAGALAFFPDGGRLVTGGRDKLIQIWNTADGSHFRTLQGHTDDVYEVTVSPDAALIASRSGIEDQTVRLWKSADGALLRTFTFPGTFPTGVQFSPDGEFLAISLGGAKSSVQIRRTSDGTVAQTLAGTLSPDGGWRTLVALVPGQAASYQTSFWKNSTTSYFASAAEEYRFSVPWQVVTFSTDSSLLLASTSGSQNNPLGSLLVLYSSTDGNELRRFTFPNRGDSSNPITWIDDRAFSPDLQLLGAISASTRLIDPGPFLYLAFWNVSDGSLANYYQEKMQLPAYGSLPIRFSPDGHSFAYTRAEGTVVLARTPNAPPALDIQRDDDSVVLSWQIPSANYILETSESTGPGAAWIAAQTAPAELGDRMVVTAGIDSQKRFFRLRTP
jgi:WD40 repeat protein